MVNILTAIPRWYPSEVFFIKAMSVTMHGQRILKLYFIDSMLYWQVFI